MADPFIVGPTGLPQLTLADWREGTVDRWRQSHGPDVPTDSSTPDGYWIDNITLPRALTGDAITSAYNNSFIRTAVAPALDLIVDLFGRTRLAATGTVVSLVWYGTTGTVVYSGEGPGQPVAAVVSATETNGDRYEVLLGSAGTIPLAADDGAVMVVRINAVTDTNDYMVDIDAVETAATTTAGPADTVQTIALAVAADIAADEPTWSITTPGLDPLGRALIVIDLKGTEVITVGANITLASEMDVFPASRLNAAAENTGPQVAIAGTVITIATPAAGLEGVTTTQDGELGRDLETDAELRIRHYDQINSTGKCTPQSIRASLLEDFPDPLMEFVRVDEALEGDLTLPGPPVITIPHHAYMVTVIGTATDQQVGDLIFSQRPAGVRSFGPIEVTTLDEVGEAHATYLNRGSEMYFHASISISMGEGFPTLGDPMTTIQLAVTAGLLEQEDMGQDIYLAFVSGLASTAVPGVASVTTRMDATAAPGDAPTLVAADITVPSTEVIRIDSSRIVVSIAP